LGRNRDKDKYNPKIDISKFHQKKYSGLMHRHMKPPVLTSVHAINDELRKFASKEREREREKERKKKIRKEKDD